jgi:hypothetical protein
LECGSVIVELIKRYKLAGPSPELLIQKLWEWSPDRADVRSTLRITGLVYPKHKVILLKLLKLKTELIIKLSSGFASTLQKCCFAWL